MKVLAMLLVCSTLGYAFKLKNPLKTKKYKCIEVDDDMEVQIVPKKASYEVMEERPEEELRLIGSASIAAPPLEPIEEEISLPQAHKVPLKKHDAKMIDPSPVRIQEIPQSVQEIPSRGSQEVPRDKQGRPLLLSPEHCQQVKRYANQYGVTDVLSWVERNCTFAKMFLPTATCNEINTLVASCYKMKYL